MFAVLTRPVARQMLVRGMAKVRNRPPRKEEQPPEPPKPEPFAEPSVEPEPVPEPVRMSNVPSLDFSPPEPEELGQRTGARRNMGRIFMAVFALGFIGHTAYMGREWEPEELKQKKLTLENAPSGRWARTKMRYADISEYFSGPQRQHGWRTAKRPGVDYFLAYISQFYEVVIFTTQHSYTAAPILEQLDRYNFFISHRLFRESTRSINGLIVKDLSYLNRDLSKVVVLDTVADHVRTHPENAIVVPKWKGDPKDAGLISLIPFLESIAIYKPADVRPIMTCTEAEGKRKYVEEWEKKHKGGMATSTWFSTVTGSQTPLSRPPIPLTYLEQKRQEAQQQYKEEQEYIKKNKAHLESCWRKTES
ncbi:import inner membrane translocase subunit tim-50 [Mycena floridula]|nr:import inner membrane translocase subunit tim-50 [Mycena floridula]